MTDPGSILRELNPQKEFFIGIDSDGCVFDSMEIKHKECFCPEFIKHFNLQRVSKYARETWEFINLYSKKRGVNRYVAIIETLELLSSRPEVTARGWISEDLTDLKNWVNNESKLGNIVLEKYLQQNESSILSKSLEWSVDVNKAVNRMVTDIPPFPYVRESLGKLGNMGDIMVVSQTPLEALEREWDQHDLSGFVRIIAGQEYGTKTEHIKFAAIGKYAKDKILMIGDAPGDLTAAKANGVLFYPIIPGDEDFSWRRFYEEAGNRFFKGTYSGCYEDSLIEEFEKSLPEFPTW